jgi:circadian clock protein KaiC
VPAKRKPARPPAPQPVPKLATHIEGFDLITEGGLPEGRTTLVAGTAGSAKTVFAAQFLAQGILHDQGGGVFVTFEEHPDDIRRNVASFGWNVPAWERDGRWAFVDGSAEPGEGSVEAGTWDLGALLARIEYAVGRTNAKRVAIDSIGSVFNQFSDAAAVRRELHRVAASLKRMGVTAVITAERTAERGPISRFEVEEFVADNVVILRNALDDEQRRRTIEVLKLRGTTHQRGEYPFTVLPGTGIVVIPLSAISLRQQSSNVRVSSGVHDIDEMCEGGFFRDSVVLVSGATGTGKTLLVTQFLAAAARTGDRALLFAFEESREQLFRNARGWGFDFEKMEKRGTIKVVCDYPEVRSLEDHLLMMKHAIEDFAPTRIAVDSLTALERVQSMKSFREFVISLTSFVKHKEVVGLFTSNTSTLMGGTSITETHVSTITDSIILLRYVEVGAEMRRGITVIKMRGSGHDKRIREFRIDNSGMHVGEAFRHVTGILSGAPTQMLPSEIDRLESLFGNG